MPSKPAPTPRFASEADARAYWETHDSTPHIDWSNAHLAPRPLGLLAGQGFSIANDCDAPLPDDLEAAFRGEAP